MKGGGSFCFSGGICAYISTDGVNVCSQAGCSNPSTVLVLQSQCPTRPGWNKGIAAIVVVGIVVILLGSVAAVFFLRRKRRVELLSPQQQEQATQNEEENASRGEASQNLGRDNDDSDPYSLSLSPRDILLSGMGSVEGESADRVGRVIARFQRQVQMFAGEVFANTASSERRAKSIGFLLKLAFELKKNNNLWAVSAIVHALRSPAVARLKVSWSRVTKDKMGKWKELSQLMSEANSFHNYFARWNATPPPRVPYLLAHFVKISELTDGVPDLHSQAEFDFRPLLKASKVVRTTMEPIAPYSFKEDAFVRSILQYKMSKAPSLETLERHSKSVEKYIA